MSIFVPASLAPFYQAQQNFEAWERHDAERAPPEPKPVSTQEAVPLKRACENPSRGSRDYLGLLTKTGGGLRTGKSAALVRNRHSADVDTPATVVNRAPSGVNAIVSSASTAMVKDGSATVATTPDNANGSARILPGNTPVAIFGARIAMQQRKNAERTFLPMLPPRSGGQLAAAR